MTRHHAHLIPTVTLLLALSLMSSVWAGPPTDQLRDGVDGVVKILRDPALSGEQRGDQRRTAIGRVAGEIFDFGEMARRSLGPHWEMVFNGLTTMAGFGSLLVADHRGVWSLGLLLVIGSAMTLSASLIVVPTLVRLGGQRLRSPAEDRAPVTSPVTAVAG
jgi:hypothetical protein